KRGFIAEIGRDSRLPSVLPDSNSGIGVHGGKTLECELFSDRIRQFPPVRPREAFHGKRRTPGTRSERTAHPAGDGYGSFCLLRGSSRRQSILLGGASVFGPR